MNIQLKQRIKVLTAICAGIVLGASCNGGRGANTAGAADTTAVDTAQVAVPQFSADSAFGYLQRQVSFGPRVPNTPAHKAAGDWLVSELKRHGAEVHEQKADLTAWDGTVLHARNIYARYNPGVSEGRLLLLAHYDTRPWADQDPDESRRDTPADGANDGASGVAVLLETARNLSLANPGRGIDILLVDAEDYGTDNNDASWALGARYFADNMDADGRRPAAAILLDMVGGKGASFPWEYFSRQSAPELDMAFRRAAADAGLASWFPETYGGAVTDDHVELIRKSVPAIDIIEYRPESGFNYTWHTHADNIDNIDPRTLHAVGQSLLQFIYAGYGFER